jgi:glycosyltransferase involved in cell wall biosynthesis
VEGADLVRILMVTNTYAPARNGVAVWAALSVRELRRRGHDVDVLTYAHDRRPSSEPGVIELPAWAGLDRDFRVAPVVTGLPELVRERSYDIVHAHHPILLGSAGVALGRAWGAKVAFTCHSVYSDYLDEYYWGVGRFLKPALARRTGAFANRCDVTFAPSTRVADWLRGCGVVRRIEAVEPPADTGRIHCVPRHAARSALGLGGRPVVFYVGRIADEKRVGALVAEFAGVLDTVPDALLVLGGGGRRERSIARDVASRGIGASVCLLGPVDSETLSQWYSAADVCASASRSETGPLSVVEAMACGCPSVALRAPGFEDRIVDGECGLLVEDRPGAIGEGLARVLLDPALRAHLSAGASRRSSLYTPESGTDRLEAVYRELLDC